VRAPVVFVADKEAPPWDAVLANRLVAQRFDQLIERVDFFNLANLYQDVDDRPGGNIGDGGAANVVDNDHLGPVNRGDFAGFTFEQPHPIWVMREEGDGDRHALDHAVGIGRGIRHALDGVPMLDDLALLIQAEDVDSDPIIVAGPFLAGVQHHVVAFGDGALEEHLLAGVILAQAGEVIDKALLAIPYGGIMLNIGSPGVQGNGFGWLVLVEHQVVKGFGCFFILFELAGHRGASISRNW
jgi:hypothetical protein